MAGHTPKTKRGNDLSIIPPVLFDVRREKKLHIGLKNDFGNVATGSACIVGGAADRSAYFVDIAVERATAVHIGIAGAGGSVAVIVNAAAADVREVLGERSAGDFRQRFAALSDVEDGAAVGSLIFFKKAVDDGRRADAEAAVVVQRAAVEIGVVVHKLAIFDARIGNTVGCVVVESSTVAAIVIDEKAVQDGGIGVSVGAVVVPACAAALQSAFLTHHAVGGAGADNEAVNRGSGAHVFGQNYGIGIVFERVGRTDFAAQHGEVLLPVALRRAAFETGKAAQQHHAVRNDKRSVAVARGCRSVLALGYPNLDRAALAGCMKRLLQIAESVLPR